MHSPAAPASALLGEDPYRQLLDAVGAFVYTTDLRGHYTYANQLVLDLLGGLALADVLGREFGDFVELPEDVRAALHAADRLVLQGGQTLAREESHRSFATGAWGVYWSIKKPLYDAQGAIIGMIGISHDITEKKRLEDQVRQQKELLDAVLNNVDALVYMKDANRHFVYANQQLAAALGLPLEQVLGRRDTELLPPEAADRFWEMDLKIMASGQRLATESALPDAHGHLRHYWTVVAPCTAPDGQQAVIGLSTDITELHQLKEELRRQASTDALTGLANRRHFFERAELELARSRRQGTPLSLLGIDLDYFKRINDDYGHPVGDGVLSAFAACCQAVLRETDLCARVGGEEFFILLPDTAQDGALAIAERLRARVAGLCAVAQYPSLRISASMGLVSLLPSDGSFVQFYARADRALYTAKDMGRDRIFVSSAPV